MSEAFPDDSATDTALISCIIAMLFLSACTLDNELEDHKTRPKWTQATKASRSNKEGERWDEKDLTG